MKQTGTACSESLEIILKINVREIYSKTTVRLRSGRHQEFRDRAESHVGVSRHGQ